VEQAIPDPENNVADFIFNLGISAGADSEYMFTSHLRKVRVKHSWLVVMFMAIFSVAASAGERTFAAGTTIKGAIKVSNWGVKGMALDGPVMLGIEGNGDCQLIAEATIIDVEPGLFSMSKPAHVTLKPQYLACVQQGGTSISVQAEGYVLPVSFLLYDFESPPRPLEFIVAKSIDY
jgi:hypothetical protein